MKLKADHYEIKKQMVLNLIGSISSNVEGKPPDLLLLVLPTLIKDNKIIQIYLVL